MSAPSAASARPGRAAVPGALDEDPLTSPSLSWRAVPASDSRSYRNARNGAGLAGHGSGHGASEGYSGRRGHQASNPAPGPGEAITPAYGNPYGSYGPAGGGRHAYGAQPATHLRPSYPVPPPADPSHSLPPRFLASHAASPEPLPPDPLSLDPLSMPYQGRSVPGQQSGSYRANSYAAGSHLPDSYRADSYGGPEEYRYPAEG